MFYNIVFFLLLPGDQMCLNSLIYSNNKMSAPVRTLKTRLNYVTVTHTEPNQSTLFSLLHQQTGNSYKNLTHTPIPIHSDNTHNNTGKQKHNYFFYPCGSFKNAIVHLNSTVTKYNILNNVLNISTQRACRLVTCL